MNDVILVTGASGGISAATIALLDADGLATHAWDLTPPTGQDRRPATQVDVTDADQVHRAWANLTATARVVGLINAAGDWQPGPIEEMADATLERVVAVNLTAVLKLCRLAVPHMVAHGAGSIVNVASMAALRPPRTASTAYAASKAGVVGLTAALAAEVGARGVRVNCVSPGAIETDMVRKNLTVEQLASYASASPAGRLGQASEVAHAIRFLLSEDASFVNGANLVVSGG